MANESVLKLIVKFGSVSFLSLFFSAFYNAADTLFISHAVGDAAAAGISVVMPLTVIQSAIAQTLGAGAASIVSRFIGKKEYEKAGSVTACAMLSFYVIAAVITVVGLIFITPVLKLSGATNEVLPYAKEYYTIILLGNVFSTGFSSIIRAEGRMNYSLMIWLIPTGVNLLLDYIFIYIFSFGIKGAALGTVIGQFCSFLMCVIFFTRFSCQSFDKIKIKFKTISEIFMLGIPTLLQLGGTSVILFAINFVLSRKQGTLGVASFAYIGRIAEFAIIPISAVCTAASPIIGFNYGAEKLCRVKKCMKISLLICQAYSVSAVALVILFPTVLLRIFTDNRDIIEYSSDALKALSFSLVFIPFVYLAATMYQAIGKKLLAGAASGSIAAFAVAAVFISYLLDMNYLWSGISVAAAFSLALSVILYFRNPLKLNAD